MKNSGTPEKYHTSTVISGTSRPVISKTVSTSLIYSITNEELGDTREISHFHDHLADIKTRYQYNRQQLKGLLPPPRVVSRREILTSGLDANYCLPIAPTARLGPGNHITVL
ncbi:hypothetical protein J6590_015006 [Homalodisca vitripennis]|nr:hypothetical protein J6590_015006 [Homalodisca vitripennis]